MTVKELIWELKNFKPETPVTFFQEGHAGPSDIGSLALSPCKRDGGDWEYSEYADPDAVEVLILDY